MIITLSGYPGTATKKIGKALSLELGLKFFSEEEIGKISGKEAVERIEEELKKAGRGRLVEGLVAPAVLKPELSVFLLSSKKTRSRNIAVVKKAGDEEAKAIVEELEKEAENAVLEAKGIDVFDLTRYDLVVNLEKIKDEGAIALVKKSLGELR